jgi:hypothetical protein
MVLIETLDHRITVPRMTTGPRGCIFGGGEYLTHTHEHRIGDA